MPRRRRADKGKRVLTLKVLNLLMVGGCRNAAEEEWARELWDRFGDQVLAKSRPGHRPWGWWHFEVGERFQIRDHRDPSGETTHGWWHPEDEAVWLAERGLLRDDEVFAFGVQLSWGGRYADHAMEVLNAHSRAAGAAS